MIPFQFSPAANVLLMPQSTVRLPFRYASNPYTWTVPLTGIRPPYYANPVYELNYPTG